MDVRDATSADADKVARIYDHYVLGTTITFEEEAIPVPEMARRIDGVLACDLPYLLLEDGGVVVGFAYASRWRERSAYRFSVETTIYLDHQRCGGGRGRRLYTALVARLRALGLHSAAGVIALPNEASVALHERLGFRPIGHLREIGFKQGRWIDVGYWQLLL